MKLTLATLVTLAFLAATVGQSYAVENVGEQAPRDNPQAFGIALAVAGAGLASVGLFVDDDPDLPDGAPVGDSLSPKALYLSGGTLVGLGALIFFLDRRDAKEKEVDQPDVGADGESRWRLGAYQSSGESLGVCVRMEF